MAKISETEIRLRLRKLESYHAADGALVRRVGDQYEYVDDYIYTAYASALANLSSAGKITNQSDATGFQFSPYNLSGTLLPYVGFFVNKSIYQSGDPTDYTWESTSGQSGFTSSERYYTTSTGLVADLGNPTEPGTNITWTEISSGNAIPSTAVWYAERFTISGVTGTWVITPVDAYIDSGQLVDTSVIADKIADNAVTTNKILNDAIDSDKIAANAVTVNAILDGAINADKIANNAVTTAAILNDAIDSDKIAANAVNTNEIAAGAITANEIQANAIGANQIAANSITAGEIATNAITADEVQAGAIGASEIAANSITAAEIAALAITATEIQAGAIGTEKLAANAVTAGKIGANEITATEIAAGAITALEIAADAILANKIKAGEIDATHLKITGDNAISPSSIGAATTAAAAAATTAAAGAQSTADGKVTTFFVASPPTAEGTGDLWMDTDDGNKLWRWNGSAWVAVQDSAIGTAISDAATAQSTADGKIVTFYATSAPTATSVGDLWVDTDDGNRLYRASATGSGNWVSVRDATIAAAQTTANTAITNAATAQGTADGKVTTFFATSAPTAEGTGDLWMDTDDGNKLYRWSSSAWVAVQDGAIATAISNAATAQSTADGKIVTFYQASAPTATSVGDMWVDTDDKNKLYRASATGSGNWVSVQDTTVADNIYTSNTTTIAGGNITTGTIDSNQINADAITVDKIDLDGTLAVTANSGAIRWNKTSGDDITNSGLYVGNAADGSQRIVLGTSTSFIYYDGNRVYTVGTSDAASIGTEINYWTSGSGIEFYISGVLDDINWFISGGGGGGGGAGGFSGAGYGGNGGTTTLKVLYANGNVRSTIGTAAGGAGGAYNNDGAGGCTGNRTGESWTAPGGFPNPPFANGTGGSMGTSGSMQGGNASGRSAGGGGAGTDIEDSAYMGGGGGCKGAYASGTYDISSGASTDILQINVGGGGGGSTNAGSGSSGAIWIQGVID